MTDNDLLIALQDGQSAKELAVATDSPTARVKAALDSMVERGIVFRKNRKSGKRGRPVTEYHRSGISV